MEVTQAKLVRGEVPHTFARGSGYGSGYGDGYGSGSGSGSGSGYGDGYGYGSGSGSGSGSGYGDGYGSGSGSGYGSGYGDGYGSGYGDGYGYGSGSGSGYGDGYGSGSKEYWLATIDAFASKWPDASRKRLAELRAAGATIAFWRSTSAGLPSNGGGKIEPAAPGVVHTAPGPLNLCERGTLHATVVPPKWKGDRWWVVAMTGPVEWDDDKVGALSREIIGECL